MGNRLFDVKNDLIVYVESQKNDDYRLFIEDNWNEIVSIISNGETRLVYSSKIIQSLSYLFPFFNSYPLEEDFDIENISMRFFAQHPQIERYSGFLIICNGGKSFRKLDFAKYSTEQIIPLLKKVINSIYRKECELFSCIDEVDIDPSCFIDSHKALMIYEFDDNMHQIAEHIKAELQILEEKGYLELLANILGKEKIELLCSKAAKEPLSPLTISEDGMITLPAYQNRELKLSPIQKAVYLLFLRHSEGICFKLLPEYRHELLQIYKHLSLSENCDKMKQAVFVVTNPCENAINEVCSQIKRIIVRLLPEYIAGSYIIQGKKGACKEVSSLFFIRWPKWIDGIECTKPTMSLKEVLKGDDICNTLIPKVNKAFCLGHFNDAIENISNIILHNPYNAYAYGIRAIVFFRIGKYVEAESDNSMVLDLMKGGMKKHNEFFNHSVHSMKVQTLIWKYHSTETSALHNRAEARLMLGKYEEGLEDIDRYITFCPSFSESYYIRSLLKMHLGDLEGADADKKIAYDMDKKSVDKPC